MTRADAREKQRRAKYGRFDGKPISRLATDKAHEYDERQDLGGQQ